MQFCRVANNQNGFTSRLLGLLRLLRLLRMLRMLRLSRRLLRLPRSLLRRCCRRLLRTFHLLPRPLLLRQSS